MLATTLPALPQLVVTEVAQMTWQSIALAVLQLLSCLLHIVSSCLWSTLNVPEGYPSATSTGVTIPLNCLLIPQRSLLIPVCCLFTPLNICVTDFDRAHAAGILSGSSEANAASSSTLCDVANTELNPCFGDDTFLFFGHGKMNEARLDCAAQCCPPKWRKDQPNTGLFGHPQSHSARDEL